LSTISPSVAGLAQVTLAGGDERYSRVFSSGGNPSDFPSKEILFEGTGAGAPVKVVQPSMRILPSLGSSTRGRIEFFWQYIGQSPSLGIFGVSPGLSKTTFEVVLSGNLTSETYTFMVANDTRLELDIADYLELFGSGFEIPDDDLPAISIAITPIDTLRGRGITVGADFQQDSGDKDDVPRGLLGL